MGVQLSELTGLLDGNGVALKLRRYLLEEVIGLFQDKNLDTWLAGTQSLSGPNNTGYCHQAAGVLLKHLFDGLILHRVIFLSRYYVLRATAHYSQAEPENNHYGR